VFLGLSGASMKHLVCFFFILSFGSS